MLAWQTLAGYSIIEGRLVMPYPVRVRETGFAHYFVTPPSRRETKVVSAFKQWVRDEIAASMQRLGSSSLTAPRVKPDAQRTL